MRETLWDLCQAKERGEGMAREMEGVRLAGSLRGKKSRLDGLVAGFFRELRSPGLSCGNPEGVQGAGDAGEGTPPA